ncbi:acid-resistance protein, partial [Yersinia enterocolitica]|nr:acid-resistance protein [Yersinia enterocolitica]
KSPDKKISDMKPDIMAAAKK